MNIQNMKKCPFCAEMIREEAVKCRYCGSELDGNGRRWISTQRQWQREARDKKFAGVCTGIARQFETPALILPLRIFFLISTVFYGFGPVLYILLWILMPAPEKDISASKLPEADLACEGEK